MLFFLFFFSFFSFIYYRISRIYVNEWTKRNNICIYHHYRHWRCAFHSDTWKYDSRAEDFTSLILLFPLFLISILVSFWSVSILKTIMKLTKIKHTHDSICLFGEICNRLIKWMKIKVSWNTNCCCYCLMSIRKLFRFCSLSKWIRKKVKFCSKTNKKLIIIIAEQLNWVRVNANHVQIW